MTKSFATAGSTRTVDFTEDLVPQKSCKFGYDSLLWKKLLGIGSVHQ
jgi:hypothetical protein